MNLATARSAIRAREIGLRKVVGAERRHLIRQFLGESLVFSFLAAGLALLGVLAALPWFRVLTGRELSARLLLQPEVFGLLTGIIIIAGLAAGIYPALLLSSFQPLQILKNRLWGGPGRSLGFRRSLVFAQFVIAITLIACTLTVYQQRQFIRGQNLGFVKEQVVTLPILDEQLQKNPAALLNELRRCPHVQEITLSGDLPCKVRSTNGDWWIDQKEQKEPLFYYTAVDAHFLDFYQIKLVAGRNFSPELAADVETAVILNQAAVKALGWKDPIGKQFGFSSKSMVAGVVEDFHFSTLHNSIEPLALMLIDPSSKQYWWNSYVSVRITGGDLPAALASLEKVFQAHSPAYPFTYQFLDEKIKAMYQTEENLSRTFNCVTGIALFISCLGIFGLASFAAARRTREVGIRKVLGASWTGLFLLLNKEFCLWILLANVLAWPVAYFAMNRWLQGFAYRITQGPGIFLLSGLLALILALLTVSWQTLQVACSRPAESLKAE